MAKSRRAFVIAEVGINHNGSLDIAKKLIQSAHDAGCDAVKFQKRTISEVYDAAALDVPRESPFGTTNREQKEGLEFGRVEFTEIDRFCKSLGIKWFASAWDVDSQIFLQQFNLEYNKVASALLTHRKLLEMIASEGRHTFISTGMSTKIQIDKAVKIFQKANCPFELMHCNSEYPSPDASANLRTMGWLRSRHRCSVGYSGHEVDILASIAASTLGATSVERHLTLDKTMYGSDQSSSIEPGEMAELVTSIRRVEVMMGNATKVVTDKEKEIAEKLRRINDL